MAECTSEKKVKFTGVTDVMCQVADSLKTRALAMTILGGRRIWRS